MRYYVAQRLISIVFVLFGVSLIVFAVMHLTPGDPARIMLGPMATPKDLARLQEELGLTDPIYVQYFKWISRALRGDFGRSISLRRAVMDEVLLRFKGTLILALPAILFSFTLGIAIGVLSAVRQYSFLDRFSMGLAMFGISMPSFWFGLVLIIIFSLHFRIFPGTGMYSPGGGNDFGDLVHHLVLPALTLAVVPMAVIARVTRSNMLEVIRQDFIRTARAKGLGEGSVTMKHAFRNTLVGIVTVLGLEVGFLLAGTVYVETVFSWPGVGSMLVNAILTRDFPLVQGGVMLIATSYVFINLATDLLYVYLDPRVHLT